MTTLERIILWLLTIFVTVLVVEMAHIKSELKKTDNLIKDMLIIEKTDISVSNQLYDVEEGLNYDKLVQNSPN